MPQKVTQGLKSLQTGGGVKKDYVNFKCPLMFPNESTKFSFLLLLLSKLYLRNIQLEIYLEINPSFHQYAD